MPGNQAARLFEERFQRVVSAAELERIGARAMAALLASARYGAAKAFGMRQQEETLAEVLFVELAVPLGQRKKVNDIRGVEPVAIAYFADDKPPLVYPLREDFPETVPHLNLNVASEPRSLCLFDIPLDEVLRLATPFVLLERARRWLRETAYGRLHGEDQPLDPLLGNSGQPVVLPTLSGELEGKVVFGSRRSDEPNFPILLHEAPPAAAGNGQVGFATMVLETPPLPHGRIRTLPSSVGELIEVFRELGADLCEPMRQLLTSWTQEPALLPLFDKSCLVVVRTPVEREQGRIGALATKAFLGIFTAGELGEALGVILRAEGRVARRVPAAAPEIDRLTRLAIGALDVFRPFDRDLARSASGLDEAPTEVVALVGAGALGSQIALTAAREGLGQWRIIDPDHLMPHNLARHALLADYVGTPKALALAREINALLGPEAARSWAKDIRSIDEAPSPLAECDLVIDASASVPVARWLASESGHTAQTASVFFNPTATDLVILQEGEGRQPRLDELEMSYYWRLVCEPELHNHLHSASGILPSGGCRNVSVQASQSRVSVLAGTAVSRLLEGPRPAAGSIEIFRSTKLGLIASDQPGERYREVELEEWVVLVRESLLDEIASARTAAGKLETGGILVGSWDRHRKRAYVVGHFDPPPDSTHSPTGFVRGMAGVYQALDAVEGATAVNLTYVGEWHTHPPGHSSNPSTDDERLLKWIGDTLVFSDVPPLMLIAGEDGCRVIVADIKTSDLA